MSASINNAVTLWRTGQAVSTEKPYESESIDTVGLVRKILFNIQASYSDFMLRSDFTNDQWVAIDNQLNENGCALLGHTAFVTIVKEHGQEIFPRM